MARGKGRFMFSRRGGARAGREESPLQAGISWQRPERQMMPASGAGHRICPLSIGGNPLARPPMAVARSAIGRNRVATEVLGNSHLPARQEILQTDGSPDYFSPIGLVPPAARETRCLLSPCSPVSPDVGEMGGTHGGSHTLKRCHGRTRFTGRSDHATTMGSSPSLANVVAPGCRCMSKFPDPTWSGTRFCLSVASLVPAVMPRTNQQFTLTKHHDSHAGSCSPHIPEC
ncbi:hypothetical protein BO83DRAFT_403090 [Aspergillus eucalypticola CBS 122712]|uniref:Uncharacterized protein n=1 Tax=Aspergillus eucalypticola (strain CBS 122712 / IBT 29274) TaxID=1448314 RepID=A0A317UQC5_ASPEC|nr:uncharacterized protein BO83DRAFT_403090 [Aspergillus eucalypticola CBS 122712]PWY63456.1 hypothetical protein BO83DRAFT_403090 [Aspergillus eucalypticola CBS 122712]